MVLYTADQINFSEGTTVISKAQKCIIRIPNDQENGDPLIYPEGEEKAGQPVRDWKEILLKDEVLFSVTIKIKLGRLWLLMEKL